MFKGKTAQARRGSTNLAEWTMSPLIITIRVLCLAEWNSAKYATKAAYGPLILQYFNTEIIKR